LIGHLVERNRLIQEMPDPDHVIRMKSNPEPGRSFRTD
jgi:hypothetical protein